MPTASTRPTTNEKPKRRASDRRRGGRAGSSSAVTAATGNRAVSASTPGSEVGRTSAASSGSPTDIGRRRRAAVRRAGRAPRARGRRRASRRRVWRRWQPGRLRRRWQPGWLRRFAVSWSFRRSCAVGLRWAAFLTTAPSSRLDANLSRRGRSVGSTGTRDVPQTLRVRADRADAAPAALSQLMALLDGDIDFYGCSLINLAGTGRPRGPTGGPADRGSCP